MRTRLTILLIILLAGQGALAHRLNEYLQATTLQVSANQLALELRLTPGMDVAGQILHLVDPEGADSISAADQIAYVDLLRHDLVLLVDDRPVTLQPVAWSFPDPAAIRNGSGDIVIQFTTNLSLNGTTHRIHLENHHETAIAVYLVDCLLPSDPQVQITSQLHNYNQSIYHLEFITGQDRGLSAAAPRHEDKIATTKTYFYAGVKHILTGYDHLLFLAALILAATSLWQLVKIVTAFTISHTLTLTLSVFNLVHLPSGVVEPVIAASIVFVAVQNILWPRQAAGNIRLAVAFAFGLFHGLGFAGGLLQLMHQLPKETVILALLGFTIGIETGNQLVLIPLFTLGQTLRRKTPNNTAVLLRIRQAASVTVAVAGAYYLYISIQQYT